MQSSVLIGELESDIARDYDDEDSLVRYCMRDRYSGIFIDLISRLSCIHMGKDPTTNELTRYSGPRKFFRVHNPWKRKATGIDRRACCRGLFLPIYTTLIMVSAVNSIIMVFLLFRRDALAPYGAWLPSQGTVTVIASAGGHCAYKNESYLAKPNKYSELQNIERWIGTWNIPFNHVEAFNEFNHTVAIIMIVSLIGLAIMMRNEKMLIDPLSFVYGPIEHRQLVRRQIDRLIAELMIQHRRRMKRAFVLRDINRGVLPIKLMYSFVARRGAQQADDVGRTLRQIHAQQLVAPACLGVNSMKRLTWIMGFCSYLVVMPGIFGILCSHIGLQVLELYALSGFRLNQIDCEKRLSPSRGEVVVLGKHIPPLAELTQDEYSMYANYDNSLLCRVTLMLRVEFWKMINPMLMCQICNLSYMVIFCTLVFLALTLIYILYLQSYKLWLDQIDVQLKLCHRTLEQTQQLEGEIEKHKHLDDQQQGQHQRAMMTQQLLVAYINFELFHRSYKRTQNYLNHIVSVALVVALSSCGLCYLKGRNGNGLTNAAMIMFSNTFVVVGDYFLIGVARNERAISQQSKSILRMVALATHARLELSPVVCMWRRQLLTKHELEEMFSPRIFGLRFSYTNFITMNLYIAAVWVLLIRNSVHDIVLLAHDLRRQYDNMKLW